MTTLKQPGRLGNPNETLATDERTDPRIARLIAQADALQIPPVVISHESSYEDCLDYCREMEAAISVAHPQLLAAMPTFNDVATSTSTIQGVDGNEITLYIHQPKNRSNDLPCLVHTHGGGMVLATAKDPTMIRWRNCLASSGMVVVGVEFRNGGGEMGDHPFPAGLNDCASAIQWTHANREDLGISSIVVSGESGGGNLCIASTLKAKQEGWLDAIDGVYALCPYISGLYASQPAELPSLHENDGYQLECLMMGALVKVYDPEGEHGTNPLAWPYHASASDLEGLPPHFVSVNELDPLRDEGLAFARKLLAAGVSTVTRTVNGTPHGGDVGFPDVTPDVFNETLRSVCGFCKSLTE